MMKKTIGLALIIVTAVSACSKKSNPQPQQGQSKTVVINGTTYSTVVIGSQTWTAVNYNGAGGANYNNSATNDPVLGKLYTYAEAQAISLPSGWRVPTADDYNKMLSGLGGTKLDLTDYGVNNAVALEFMSTTGWTGTNGNNQLGFNAYPAGVYSQGANAFLYAGQQAFFLIETDGINVYISLNFSVAPLQTQVNHFFDGTLNRASLRFVKDN